MKEDYLKVLGPKGKEKVRARLNGVLMEGETPEEWRRSRIVLLHKGGEKQELRNYRPVAITNILYKVCMFCVRERERRYGERTGGSWRMSKGVSGRADREMTTCSYWRGHWRCLLKGEMSVW